MPVIAIQPEWPIAKPEQLNLLEARRSRHLKSRVLKRMVTFEIFLPASIGKESSIPLLLMNDGQDCDDLRVEVLLAQWLWANPDKPFVWVGVHAGDRMHEYGVVNRPDCNLRGSKANLYQQFLIEELLPHLELILPVKANHPENAFIGFSLGGLSAFDLSWRNPNLFPVAGAFSASFWWRSKDLNNGYTDADRIIHQVVRTTRKPDSWRIWLQAGSEDENDDRNGNGIIDAIEDTLDLMKELKKLGFNKPQELRFVLAKSGHHNQHTWSQVIPDFLAWWLKQPVIK